MAHADNVPDQDIESNTGAPRHPLLVLSLLGTTPVHDELGLRALQRMPDEDVFELRLRVRPHDPGKGLVALAELLYDGLDGLAHDVFGILLRHTAEVLELEGVVESVAFVRLPPVHIPVRAAVTALIARHAAPHEDRQPDLVLNVAFQQIPQTGVIQRRKPWDIHSGARFTGKQERDREVHGAY